MLSFSLRREVSTIYNRVAKQTTGPIIYIPATGKGDNAQAAQSSVLKTTAEDRFRTRRSTLVSMVINTACHLVHLSCSGLPREGENLSALC